MKLTQLNERRHKPRHVTVYHGTDADVSQLMHGLKARPPQKDYAAWTQKDRPGVKATFLTASLPLALYYGTTIVEVLLNIKSHEASPDEEHFPLGEIPGQPPNQTNQREWDQFFRCAEQYKMTASEKEQLVAQAIQSYDRPTSTGHKHINCWDDGILNIVRKIMRRNRIRSDYADISRDYAFASNIMYQNDIGFTGRTRIVGISRFSETSDERGLRRELKCTKIYYNKGGTITLGQEAIPTKDWSSS